MRNKAEIAKCLKVSKDFINQCFASLDTFDDLSGVKFTNKKIPSIAEDKLIGNFFRMESNYGKSFKDLENFIIA